MSSSSVDDIHSVVINAIFLDSATITDYLYAPLNMLLQAEYHDTSTIILLISPELNLLIEDYILAYVDNSGMLMEAVSLFDSFVTTTNYVPGEALFNIIVFFIFSLNILSLFLYLIPLH